MTEASRSSPSRDLAALMEFAVGAAREAGQVTLAHFGTRVPSLAKSDGTPVTEADRAAEELLRRLIAGRFPRDGIVGEEFGQHRPEAPYRWILDPIDGTRSFIRGVPLYAVLIGLEFQDTALLGVIHMPALSETVVGARGQGTYLDGTRSTVSDVEALSSAVALTTDPAAVARSPVARGWNELASRAGYVRGWGDAYGHALVATGRAEIMVDPELALWDAAPLLPILEGAGGAFTSLDGNATIRGGSGVSTNGVLHREVLDTLATHRDPPSSP